MDNSESKKSKKQRKVPNKSLRQTSSEQKENVPKNEKGTASKSTPDGGIAKSKLLLMKKNKTRARRQPKHERICPNGADPEEEEPKSKKAKKSMIKSYSKSTFNALSDEISKKLTENESGNVSDCSSDSNKTIEYDVTPYTPYQPLKPRPFSPLPSTSRDRETFIKNDELFNESLKAIDAMEQSSPLTEKATENSNVKLEETTPAQQSSQNEVEIIDIPYDTIVIDENSDTFSQNKIKNEVEDSDLIQILEPQAIKVPKDEQTVSNLTNDDDCIIITSETVNEDSRETIIIEDEYSCINEPYPLNDDEPYDVINIDDILNENKSILSKWKNKTELNKITTVIEVPDDYRNTRMSMTTTVTDSTNNHQSNSHTNQNESVVIVDSQSPQTITEDSQIQSTRLQQNEQTQQTLSEPVEIIQEVPQPQESVFRNILDDFFRQRTRKGKTGRPNNTQQLERIFESFINTVPSSNNSNQIGTLNIVDSHTATNNFPIQESRQRAPEAVSTPPQQTTSTPQQPSPEPKRSLGDCPICLDSLTSNGIASTLCGHVFCVDCIKTAIRQNGKKCPTCRKALKGPNGGYHLLYL
ncbi:E3 ubiquitin-protein ligase BRE1-like isoform X2 [Spodoptera litura]|uniref:E3 ubiquitin-protein ligase BRE1-like isoform X2 n=1 Tax=Spodoptera litura TaxID=69820 RepID=A0A9J7E1E5_SPOLT|nr:E3 ubiquitin-protein ligase BRE1-like isoform X2 [Spodoptera litura]